MKPPKNRRKSFRVHCGACHASQDSLLYACTQCKQRLYTNMEEDELVTIQDQVSQMESILGEIEDPKPQKGNPYQGMDRAWTIYRALRAHQYLPGMATYLDQVLLVLLPVKLRLMQRTVKANWVFFGILMTFPIVTLAFGMNGMVIGLLTLPAVVWLLVAFRAIGDLKKTKARLAQILES